MTVRNVWLTSKTTGQGTRPHQVKALRRKASPGEGLYAQRHKTSPGEGLYALGHKSSPGEGLYALRRKASPGEGLHVGFLKPPEQLHENVLGISSGSSRAFDRCYRKLDTFVIFLLNLYELQVP